MNHIEVRISSHDEENLNILKNVSKYMYAYEGGKDGVRPHMHFYLVTPLKRGAIQARCKKLSGYKPGNGFYKTSTLVPEPVDGFENDYIKYLGYIIKEANYVQDGFSLKELEEIVRYNEEYKAAYEKSLKKRRQTVLQQIEEKYFSDIEDGVNKSTNEFVSREEVVDSVLEFYKDRGTLIRQFMIVSVCQTLCLKYVNSYTLSFKNKILESL